MSDRGVSFSWVNHLTDSSMLAASSQVDGLPAANLLTDFVYEKWRSDATTTVSFTIMLPAARPVRVLGIFGSIYSALATWRLRLSNVAPGAGELFDSGIGAAGFVRVNAVADGDLSQAVMVLPASVTARYGQLDLDDPGSPRPYSQAGKMWLGDLQFPKFGRSWAAKTGLPDPSAVNRSIAGTRFVDVRDAARQTQFRLDFLSDAEANGWARDFILTVRKKRPFLMVPEANLPYQNNNAIYGSFTGDLPDTTYTQVDIRSQPYQIEEML